MDQSSAKIFLIGKGMIEQFTGYNSSGDKTKIAPNFFVQGSQNVYKKLSGNISVRQGQKLYITKDTTQSAISSEFVWNTSWGATYTLFISNSKLNVLVGTIVYTLISGLTKTRYVFDKWWDNTLKKDDALFVKGDSDIQKWGGGFGLIASTTVNTIVLDRTIVASVLPASGSVIINGNTYTYSGSSGSTLTGVNGNPTGEANGSGVLETVTTTSNKPASGFNNDFIKVINNRLYVGSYTSRLIYISSSSDYTNFTIPSPIIPGSANLLTLDSTAKGIGVKTGNPFIGYGTSEWMEVTFPTFTNGSGVLCEQITPDIKPVAKNAAPLAHEFIANSGDNIIYLSQDQQVRELGNFNNLFVTGYPSLSQEIATELSAEDFTNGALKCIGEFTYITAPKSGRVYLYQVRQSVKSNEISQGSVSFDSNSLITERLWHAPFIWNITRIDDIGGITYGFSNANPQIYQLWDTNQWHDDSPSGQNLPYTCILAMSYRNGGRENLVQFDKNYTEGYLTAGTALNLTINYDYLGATNQIKGIINSIKQPAYTFGQSLASLGDSSLGDKPLGDELNTEVPSNPNNLVKFRCINSLGLINCFEFQVVYQSETLDAQWEILATGVNLQNSKVDPTYIINKIRL